MQDYDDEIHEDVERVFRKINTLAHDLVLLGSEIERIDFFDKFRQLIAEKDLEGDTIAVEVLSWAYEQLAEL